MNHEPADTMPAELILENITRTLLYEGYALYPYHRSAIKNQKPIPFGVVFPQQYNTYNEHAHSMMQSQCIVTGSDDLQLNITVRFLHLKKIELLEKNVSNEKINDDFFPVHEKNINGHIYQTGWQTIERKITAADISISALIEKDKIIPIEFDVLNESENIYDNGEIRLKQNSSISKIIGIINIKAVALKDIQNAFQVTTVVTNTTTVKNAENVTRDEIISQSFLSTHIILQTVNAEFISHQGPEEKWKTLIAGCENINTWPILIDEGNTTLLSSPIILYDYPQINPQSPGDLFDSTEIEEALLLHVSVLSDEEKKKIAQSDEKLKAMLNKVSQVTPEELINFHGGLKDNLTAINTKKE